MENVKELEMAELAAIEEALKAMSSHAAPTRETSHATWQEDRGMNDVSRCSVIRARPRSRTSIWSARLIETETYKRYEGSLSRSPSSRPGAP